MAFQTIEYLFSYGAFHSQLDGIPWEQDNVLRTDIL